MARELSYKINDPIEFNLSYIPFINEGGLFIPTQETFLLNEIVQVDLKLLAKKESIKIDGKVIWITPQNSLYHVIAGIGIQFINENAKNIRTELEKLLDHTIDVGGYTYGITVESKRP